MSKGTSIGRVRGLGSAHAGTHQWLLQRLTALSNLTLMIFLLISLAGLGDWGFRSVAGWLAHPLPSVALALFIVSVFWHARLGLQVLIEDYVHEGANKVAVMAALNLAAFGGAAAALFFLARIVFAAAGAEAAAGALQAAQGGR